MPNLDFWSKTSGTWINVFTVILGTSLGLVLKDRLSAKIQTIITQGIGLLTIWIGLTMANSMGKVQAGGIDGAVLGLIAIVLGGMVGEWLQIEEKLTTIGEWLKQKFRGKGLFTEGFVASSLLFCVGPMALLGSFNNGLTILFYQGSLSLMVGSLANIIPQADDSPYLLIITGIGGLMIMAIGCNLLEIAKIRVASFLPAIAFAPLFYLLAVLRSS